VDSLSTSLLFILTQSLPKNIVDQNKELESWPNVLQYLPRSLHQFFMKQVRTRLLLLLLLLQVLLMSDASPPLDLQWREDASAEQLELATCIVCAHLGIERSAVPVAGDYGTRKHAPQLKIRGLLFRD